MITISLVGIYLIYFIYFLFLVGFIVFSAVALFHLSEYGYVGDFSRSIIVIYLAAAAIIMLLTIFAMILFR